MKKPSEVRDILNLNFPGSPVQMGTELVDRKVHILRATYDFAVLGGAIGTVTLKGLDGKDAKLPANAIIKQTVIDTITALDSGGLATVSVGLTGDDDALMAADDFDDLTGIMPGTQDGAAANMLKSATEKSVTATIATAALTDGKFHVHIEYMISQ